MARDHKYQAEVIINSATRGGKKISSRLEDQIALAQVEATLAVVDELQALRELLETEVRG